ncbi:MAG: hypothetical protein QOD45_1733, partial [Pseudonocardiales bacterium]|nr:hypothetical protein [Pseudonocardiales bacterium]
GNPAWITAATATTSAPTASAASAVRPRWGIEATRRGERASLGAGCGFGSDIAANYGRNAAGNPRVRAGLSASYGL